MKKIAQTDWMIMGMIHAYKIIQKTKDEFSGDSSLNDIDFQYLVEMQKRNSEKHNFFLVLSCGGVLKRNSVILYIFDIVVIVMICISFIIFVVFSHIIINVI